MPRKYRPPASSKRRKTKTVEYDFPTPPEEAGASSAVEDEDGEYEDDMEDAVVQAPSRPAIAAHDRPERHVRRDYTYVRNEAIRIGIIGSVLIAGIVVIGFFR